MSHIQTMKTKENLYKECIEMLQTNDPNGDYWAIIFEHGHDYDKAMKVVQECVSMSLSIAITDDDEMAANFNLSVLNKAIKY